jgi:hypothetical protein
MYFTGVILNPYRRPINDESRREVTLRRWRWNPEGFYGIDLRVYIKTLDYGKFKSMRDSVLGFNSSAVRYRFAAVGKVAVYTYTVVA